MITLHTQNNYENLQKHLQIDCSSCAGLCCVALYYAKSEGFPCDKMPGTPCSNLDDHYRCKIHEQLEKKHLKGCMAYDCFGAGQKVAKDIYKNKNWKTDPDLAGQMFDVFLIVHQLQQILDYLIEASTLAPAAEYLTTIDALIQENISLTSQSPEEILTVDVDSYREKANTVLKKVSHKVAVAFTSNKKKQNIDCMGKNFKHANLDGVDFSTCFLIAANLEGCSLVATNFLGADMRDTNIKDTDLSKCIFLSQMQINSAKGNHNTRLPKQLTMPSSWLQK